MKVVIHTQKLSKYYGKNGEVKAVDELSLDVYEAETFGLLGQTEQVRRQLFAF